MTLTLVMGLPLAGKSTFARAYAGALDIDVADTSDTIFAIYAERHGITIEAARALPKEEIRPELIEIGDGVCAADPAGLVRPLLARGARVVAGIRRREELLAVMDEFYTRLYWIERPGNASPADNTEAAALRLICEMHGKIIENVGTMNDLFIETAKLAVDDAPAHWG